MAVFNMNNEVDRSDFKSYVNDLYKASLQKGFIVEVKKKHAPRSTSQNAYLHYCLSYFASEFGYMLEEVKQDIFKRQVNYNIFARQRMNRRHQVVTYMRSTSDLDKKEMTDAIEHFRNWSQNYAGLYIPEPADGTDAYIEAMKQIAAYENYL